MWTRNPNGVLEWSLCFYGSWRWNSSLSFVIVKWLISVDIFELYDDISPEEQLWFESYLFYKNEQLVWWGCSSCGTMYFSHTEGKSSNLSINFPCAKRNQSPHVNTILAKFTKIKGLSQVQACWCPLQIKTYLAKERNNLWLNKFGEDQRIC